MPDGSSLSAVPGPAVPSRRDAKSRATRLRLLDATAEALVEVGYAGTSTQEVCRRAGVSRGTLLHHYGTRAELVVAALAHVLDERLEEFRFGFEREPAAHDRAARVIDRLWGMVTGPTFYAWLELAVASRTDDALRAELVVVMGAFDERVRATFAELFPDAHELGSVEGVGALADVAPSFAFAVLNGLAVDHIYKRPAELPPVVNALKALGRLIDREA